MSFINRLAFGRKIRFFICDAFNQLNIDKKLGYIQNYYMKEKFEKIKRKFIEISERDASLSRDEDLDQSSVFFSENEFDTKTQSVTKRRKI